MNVKIDTKEKFLELHLQETQISANMAADLAELLSQLHEQAPHNLVMSLEGVEEMAPEAAETIAQWQSRYYEQSHSFVLCHLVPAVEQSLDEQGLLEILNVTPTLSEAWDIVQMEEIERELLDGFED